MQNEECVDFIEDEGNKIAGFINAKMSYDDIRKNVNKDHSENTFTWALLHGINHAADKRHAEIIRRTHNGKYGCAERAGLVHPDILRLERM